MEQGPVPASRNDWIEASGLRHLLRTLGFAVHPAKLGLALAGIILTFALGGLLDVIWSTRGGIDTSAVTHFIVARQIGTTYNEPTGDGGIFETWWHHERGCMLGLLHWFVPFVSSPDALTTPGHVAARVGAVPLSALAGMLYGVWWLFRCHFFFFLIFAIGFLFIWSLAGGAICRIAALQFARDEKQTFMQGLQFARKNLFGGFLLAPCIPLVLVLLTLLALGVGGTVLRFPVLGDLVGGLAFFLALLGGFMIAALVIGTVAGGSLFWPAIAAEGQDAYDAFSRGLSYAFSRPWKALLYAFLAFFFAGVCWIIVNVFVALALMVTRTAVSFGTSPFGWWKREVADANTAKLDLLWPAAAGGELYAWPEWQHLAWYEYFSAFMIGIYVLLIVALIWSFLASFYFSGSTIIYFLLRRDVDGTDLEEVQLDGYDDENVASIAPDAANATKESPTEKMATSPASSPSGISPAHNPPPAQPLSPPTPAAEATPQAPAERSSSGEDDGHPSDDDELQSPPLPRGE